MAPILATRVRAFARGSNDNKFEPVRASHNIELIKPNQKFPVKHEQPWTLRGTRPTQKPFEPSIIEPEFKKSGAESPERLKIR